jgi:nucleoside-diphosphate-sugar epimerase
VKVVITGGAGKLGQVVVRELISHGYEVISIDVAPLSEHICRSQIVDLKNIKDLCVAIDGASAVIHLARKPFPYTYTDGAFNTLTGNWNFADKLSDAELFNYNVGITYNVIAACSQTNVGKLILGSSLAIYGFYYPACRSMPAYLPVDENHPLWPQDAYSLSKLVAEEICKTFTRESNMQIISLRFAGITFDSSHSALIERRSRPFRWAGALWSYIDVRDAAVACRLSLASDFGSGHEAFNICAPTTMMNVSTRELIREYLPDVTRINLDSDENWSGYTPEKARNILGFRARFLL